jgi:hypothetical protein
VVSNIWAGAAGIQPDADASATEVVDAFTEHGDAFGLLVAWVAVNVVILGLFVAAAAQRLQNAAPVATRLGSIGGILLMAFFPLVNVPLVVLAIGGDGLADSPDLVDVLWDAHNALFAFAGLALGLALLGFSLAAVQARLVPRWFRFVGPIGAALMIAGSVPVKLSAEGSEALMFGLAGFAVWLLFLLVIGTAMWREDPAAP